MPPNKSQKSIELGIWGEDKACEYLEKQGYTIIERNAHVSQYEIDIIAVKDSYILFVEVKTRTYNEYYRKVYGKPSKAINYKKIENLYEAASMYIQSGRGDYDKSVVVQPCIDAIEISVSENDGVRNIVEFIHTPNILRYRKTGQYYEDY